jgi:hypothetical protein
MSRQTLKLLALLLVLAALVPIGTGGAEEVTERAAELTLDCLSGVQPACDELDQLQSDPGADLPTATAPTSDPHTALFDAYKTSAVRPGELDSFIQANRSVFDSQFFSCLSAIRAKAPTLARTHDEQCNVHVDPAARINCLQLNAWRDMDRHLSDLERTIRSNGGIRWLQTPSGQQAAVATQITKSQIQQYRQDTYPQLVFALGQQLADQNLQSYIAQLYAGLDRTVEPLRGALYCGGTD